MPFDVTSKYQEIFRFGIVGIIATIIHYGTYWLFLPFFSATISYSFGYLVSLALNYCLTSFFTFQEKPSVKNGIGFGLSHLINYLLHTSLLKLYLLLGIAPLIAPIFVFPIVVPINFLLQRFVFKH